MENENKIIKEHNEKTWIGFFYSIFGVTLPFILSLIGILIIGKYDHIVSFIDDGQIFLFSAGLLTSAYYIFSDEENQKSLKKLPLRHVKLVNHLTIAFLIVTSVIYAILYSIGISHSNIDLNTWFIRISSVIIFAFATYASFSSIYIDFMKVYPVIDVERESKKGVEDIMNKL
jgi:hypothetical protein